MDDSIELWKHVVGFEGIYQVSDHGNVRRILSREGKPIKRQLSPHLSRGYPMVHLRFKPRGLDINAPVHRLVAEAFLGPRPDDMEINHKDTVKTNNWHGNLEYLTHLEHARHTVEHTGRARGNRNVNNVLDEKDIPVIRRLLAKGMTQTQIAEVHGVRQQTISSIKRGKLWGHIP